MNRLLLVVRLQEIMVWIEGTRSWDLEKRRRREEQWQLQQSSAEKESMQYIATHSISRRRLGEKVSS